MKRLRTETISTPGSASIARTRDFDTAGRLTSESLDGAATTSQIDGGSHRPAKAAHGNRPRAIPFWTETTTDGFGRTVSEKTPMGGAEVEKAFVYNPDGSLQSEGTPGFAAGGSDDLAPLDHQRFYGAGLNNVNGLVAITTQQSGEGPRIQSSTEYYAQEGADWYRIEATNRGTSKEKVSGFVAGEMSKRIDIDPLGNVTTSVALLNRPAKTVTRTVSRTGLNDAITIQRNGLIPSATTPSVSAPTIIGYDGHGRRITVKDARTALVATTTYDADFGQVETVTGPGVAVSNTYYPKTDRRAGRLATRTVNTAITRFDYDDLGRQTHVWGAAAYPWRYDFDGNGRLWKLHTYRNPSPNWNAVTWPAGAGDGDVTTWSYFGGTAQLQAKADAAGKATTYTYWPSGLLKRWAWARLAASIFTDYTYNDAGEMKKTDYSDSTPDVEVTAHDSEGNPTTILDAAGTHTLTYDPLGQIESESIAGGILAGVNLNPEYTTARAKGRLKEWNLSGPAGLALQHTNGYESGTGRLKTVSDGPSTATYDYLGNSDWLNTTTVAYSGATALTTTRTPDTANRLASIGSTRGGQTIESHAWTYDSATGQRIRDTLADNRYWQYGYNDRNEVQSGVKKQADDSAQPGYDYGYSYDPIGNRLSTTTNGRPAGYVSNSLNQYDQRDVP